MVTAARTTAGPGAARKPAMDRPLAMALAATEYDRFLAALRRLDDADWVRPTECSPWDVHDLAGHVLGMAEMAASVGRQLRQGLAAARRGGEFIDALTAVQVAAHKDDSPQQIVSAFAVVAPKAARARRRVPAVVRRRAMPMRQRVGADSERWSLGFLLDIVLTRDTWMHRLDLTQAVGTAPELTAAHDGLIVADVAQEWAQRHGRECTLRLTGPAGGTWSWGRGEVLECDAVDFCRLISGRGAGSGLLAVQVPF